MVNMHFLKKHEDHVEKPGHVHNAAAAGQRITFLACFLGLVASIGGFMFGYVR